MNIRRRKRILERDGYKCYYCNKDLVYMKAKKKAKKGCKPSNRATIDHLIPTSKGGNNSEKNLVACCEACNFEKSDKVEIEKTLDLVWTHWSHRTSIPIYPKGYRHAFLTRPYIVYAIQTVALAKRTSTCIIIGCH